MASIAQLNTPFVMVGLGEVDLTIPATGIYSVIVNSTEVPPSGISIVVKDGSTTLYTAPTLSPTQGAIQFRTSFPATAADTIKVILSSSNASDKLLNTVKSTVYIQQGQ